MFLVLLFRDDISALSLTGPPRVLEKQGKTPTDRKNAKEIPERDKSKRNQPPQKNKGKKDRVVRGFHLRGLAAIVSISRDTCSDSIGESSFVFINGVSHNYRAICCTMGYRTDVPV